MPHNQYKIISIQSTQSKYNVCHYKQHVNRYAPNMTVLNLGELDLSSFTDDEIKSHFSAAAFIAFEDAASAKSHEEPPKLKEVVKSLDRLGSILTQVKVNAECGNYPKIESSRVISKKGKKFCIFLSLIQKWNLFFFFTFS